MQNSQFVELQPALVTKFMKKVLKDDQFILSSNLKQKFSRSLTIFVHYIFAISSQIAKEKHRATVSVEDLKKALDEAGFEDVILEKLESKVLSLGIQSTKTRKIPEENAGNAQEIQRNVQVPEDFMDEEVRSEENAEDEEIEENAGDFQGNVEEIDENIEKS